MNDFAYCKFFPANPCYVLLWKRVRKNYFWLHYFFQAIKGLHNDNEY